jgi:hypothetical protein
MADLFVDLVWIVRRSCNPVLPEGCRLERICPARTKKLCLGGILHCLSVETTFATMRKIPDAIRLPRHRSAEAPNFKAAGFNKSPKAARQQGN